MTEVVRKRETSIIITSVCFLITFLPYFFNIPIIDAISLQTVNWALITSYFMVLVGLYYLYQNNISRFQKRQQSWQYGIIVLILVAYMVIAGFGYGTTSTYFTLFFNSIALPASALGSGIMAFYFLSAAARTYKMKNLKTMVLIIATITVILKNAPIGIFIWPGFGPIGSYTIDVLVSSANRAFKIGTATAGIALGMRILLGQETSQIGLASEG
jgi:hypothetical protein